MLNIETLVYAGVSISLLNLSIVEYLKKFCSNQKLVWILAVIIGIFEGVLLFSDGDVIKGVLIGIMLGLSSIGMYSSGKNTIEFKNDNEDNV